MTIILPGKLLFAKCAMKCNVLKNTNLLAVFICGISKNFGSFLKCVRLVFGKKNKEKEKDDQKFCSEFFSAPAKSVNIVALAITLNSAKSKFRNDIIEVIIVTYQSKE